MRAYKINDAWEISRSQRKKRDGQSETTGELMELVFSTWSILRVYNENKKKKLVI
jgi:hypothetical protein